MKKLIVAFYLILAAAAPAFAQKPPQEKKTTIQPETIKISECCIMKGGKMYHYMNGKDMLVVKDMDMNGMKVSADGSCTMKNGKTMKLKEGECCDNAGNIHKDCAKLLKK